MGSEMCIRDRSNRSWQLSGALGSVADSQPPLTQTSRVLELVVKRRAPWFADVQALVESMVTTRVATSARCAYATLAMGVQGTSSSALSWIGDSNALCLQSGHAALDRDARHRLPTSRLRTPRIRIRVWCWVQTAGCPSTRRTAPDRQRDAAAQEETTTLSGGPRAPSWTGGQPIGDYLIGALGNGAQLMRVGAKLAEAVGKLAPGDELIDVLIRPHLLGLTGQRQRRDHAVV